MPKKRGLFNRVQGWGLRDSDSDAYWDSDDSLQFTWYGQPKKRKDKTKKEPESKSESESSSSSESEKESEDKSKSKSKSSSTFGTSTQKLDIVDLTGSVVSGRRYGSSKRN